MPDLRVTLSGLRLRNPTMLAAGILGTSASMLTRAYREGAGAVVTKSVGLSPRSGYPNPTIVEVECGYVNAMGLPNPGTEEFASEVRDAKKAGVKLVASVYGFSAEDFAQASVVMEEAGADGIELNLSCPHVSGTGVEIGADLDLVSDVVKAVGDVTSVPIFAKISALYPRVPELGAVVERSGADGITAINTLRAMVIDTTVRRPILAGIYGGLSGPAIRPVAVRCVYELYESVDIPIIGVGGITGWEDAVEFVLAGATAVQIGTAVGRRGLRVFKDVTEGLRRYLADGGFKSIKDVIGLAHGE